jgi:hypothetical protein
VVVLMTMENNSNGRIRGATLQETKAVNAKKITLTT